ncbi:MAG: bacterial transcriptional activator domain-containing protein [Deltaproteobacteria bacterium]|nr:bacterial transcriptional activator domain-containing protein [Deltaproteobacteria bacterium]MBW2394978.1 bacterial transcriptional activator domain-containing protein [Deltaproteobacteria bacterium]
MTALEAYESGLALYRGDYLEGAFEGDWGSLDRTRLRSSFVRASLRAAALRMGLGDFDAALRWARGALLADDLAEAGYRMQALVYLRQEDRAAARASLASGMKRLVDAGLDPDAETRRIAQRLGLGREAYPGG